MDYETALKTCSEEVQAAIRWLEENVKFDKSKWEQELENVEGFWKEEIRKQFLRRLKVEYLCGDALWFYVLSKVNSQPVTEFFEAAKNDEFWLGEDGPDGFDVHLFENPYLLWYLSKLELNENIYFQEALEAFIKKQQTVEGRIPSDDFPPHTHSLRVLVSVEPDSKATNLAVKYFLNHFARFKRSSELEALAIGILALLELDYRKFKDASEDSCNFIKNEQKEEGYWGEIRDRKDGTLSLPIEKTSIIIDALSKVFGPTDEFLIKAVKWLKSNQKEDGSWGSLKDTSHACLALMSVGEGPKIPLEEVEWQAMLTKQELKYIKPHFLHTSPEYYKQRHIEDIQKTIRAMFQSAESEIKILSPHFELLHDELIKILADKPDLILKVMTRPKEEQARHNQKIIDLLNKHTKGNCRSNWKLHARMVIVDNREVLISSSDLDRNGLIDQYNAGIWTRDEETVEAAVKFFENLWTESGDETA